MIIKDDDLLHAFRLQTRCEWCGQPTPGCDPHHLHARGLGGGSRLDIAINLIGLCRRCHNDCHAGNVTSSDLRAVIARREHTTQDAIQTEIWRLLRARTP